MASVTIKILSLFVRTLSKPIANRIKRQARSHEGFRKICISGAQTLHRIDMRLRLGLLQDPEVLERQIAREAERVRKKEIAKEAETIKKEQEQEQDESTSGAKDETKDKDEGKDEKERQDDASKKEKARLEEAAERVAKNENSRISRQIKPLSEAKAIELGTNFLGEAFVFGVALAVLLATEMRGRRKEGKRREDVADRLDGLESERDELRKRVEGVESELRRERERSVGRLSADEHGHEGEKEKGEEKASAGKGISKKKAKEEHHKPSEKKASRAMKEEL